MGFVSSPSPYPILEISRSALESNIKLIHKIIDSKNTNCKVLIPVKANAYGCGLETLMPVFQSNEIDMLGVANIREAESIRSLGWQKPILNLGSFYIENIQSFFEYNITPTITDLWQISALEEKASSLGKQIDVHIKLDLGMRRLGIREEQIKDMLTNLNALKHLFVSGIYTHYPTAGDKQSKATVGQLKKFQSIINNLKRETPFNDNLLVHSANSYAMLLHKETHLNMVRPGILFYGYFQTMANLEEYSRRYRFKPCLKLRARPISLRTLSKGDLVSYGSTYQIKSDNTSVGVIPLGYADGIPRSISNRIAFEGHDLIGNVTMDQIILKGVTENSSVYLLDEKSTPLEYWAQCEGTITYEILTGLGARLRRKLVND